MGQSKGEGQFGYDIQLFLRFTRGFGQLIQCVRRLETRKMATNVGLQVRPACGGGANYSEDIQVSFLLSDQIDASICY